MTPFRPITRIVSFSLKTPFVKITSIVVPCPSILFTSMTTQFKVSLYSSLFFINKFVSLRRFYNISGIPSPECALVGTIFYYSFSLGFSVYILQLRSCSKSCKFNLSYFVLKSCLLTLF